MPGCDDNHRNPEREAVRTPPRPTTPPAYVPPSGAARPLRRSERIAHEDIARIGMDAMVSALLPDALPSGSTLAGGEIVLKVTVLQQRAETMEALRELGFAERGESWERTVLPAGKKAFREALRAARAKAMEAALRQRQRLAALSQPGLIRDERGEWEAGELVYTGHALDLAMPDAGTDKKERFFLPLVLGEKREGLDAGAGERAYARGGRLFVDPRGGLRLGAGSLDVSLAPVPASATEVRIAPDGAVEAHFADGTAQPLGRISIARFAPAEGDGQVFRAPAGGQLLYLPSIDDIPALRTGHLEFPKADARAETERLAGTLRLSRLLQNLEAALSGAPAAALHAGGNEIKLPDPPAETAQTRTLMVANDLALARPHLAALGVRLDHAPNRTDLTVPLAGPEFQRTAAAFGKVLQGLLQRMHIAQQNYDNAKRLRDENNQLRPYRRKVVKLGNEGEVLVDEDPSPFRAEVAAPGHPDADKDGKINWPNVNRAVERADFEKARAEYKLVRAALERFAPDFIFPDPPEMQLEAKAP